MDGRELAASLDRKFNDCVLAVDKEYVFFGSRDRIVIEKWVQRLSEPHALISWKKNRNLYAKLLRQFVHDRKLHEPFNHLPPDGDLPNLPTYMSMYLKKPTTHTPGHASRVVHDGGSAQHRKSQHTSTPGSAYIRGSYDASASRLKDQMDELKRKVGTTNHENRLLRDENDVLRADRQRLESELEQARRVLSEQRTTIRRLQECVTDPTPEPTPTRPRHSTRDTRDTRREREPERERPKVTKPKPLTPHQLAMTEKVQGVIRDTRSGYDGYDSEEDPNFLKELQEYHDETLRLRELV